MSQTEMRQRPVNADELEWMLFERYADEHGIGTEPEDWGFWWDIWDRAYYHGGR